MESNDIIVVGREVASRLAIPLEGRARVNEEARKAAEEFSMLPYLDTWSRSFPEKIYARITKRIPSPTKEGYDLLVITTYPISTGIVYLCVLELQPTKIDKIVDERLQQIIGSNNREALLNYTERSLLEDIVSSVFPEERWDYVSLAGGVHLLIHFPKAIISNSKGQKHEILDLFVGFPLSSDKQRVQGTLVGRRMTVTPAEVLAGYRHSHLGSAGRVGFGTFCLGHTVNNTLMQQLISFNSTDKLDADKFFVFLHQLEGYVAWESIEGGPHAHLGNVRSGPINRSQPVFTNFSNVGYGDSIFVAERILRILHPDDLLLRQNSDGSHKWVVNHLGETARKLKQGVIDYWEGPRYAFDPAKNTYIDNQRRLGTDYELMKRQYLDGTTFTFRGKLWKPQVIGDSAQDEAMRLVQMPPPEAFRKTMEIVNSALNAEAPTNL